MGWQWHSEVRFARVHHRLIFVGDLLPKYGNLHNNNNKNLLPSTTIHSILSVQTTCLAIFLHILSTSYLILLLLLLLLLFIKTLSDIINETVY